MLRSIILVAIVLTGCTSPAIFRDPKSGQVAQCSAAATGGIPFLAQHEINECAATYARMGWERQ